MTDGGVGFWKYLFLVENLADVLRVPHKDSVQEGCPLNLRLLGRCLFYRS